jgi:acetoacetyl-[acyl-carrier protein] synthase
MRIDEYDARAGRGELEPIYQFGEGVLGGEDLEITTEEIRVPGYGQPVSLSLPNPFADYTE